MAHEILAVKMCELDEQLSRLSSRIHLSETTGSERLRCEIKALAKECNEAELTLQKKFHMSKAPIVTAFADSYEQIEQIVRGGRERLQEHLSKISDPEEAAEEKILLAEYALDFAVLTADLALLLSMEAIDAGQSKEEVRV